ncbi:monocarboxylate transporter [Aspergillus steynii IBT 23096]|uniref:Monocarboxylate transporter n=1 Tax=Aspergillus steynii IBT 23096 TaxID=1392250 RepID=A0A2I2GM48_9EURO|nr:monocarboxylate transporter [Aspergillus steynii IBT 23096]PLB53946.1 monocarboxylate transporter [Aspergillus steynii IBT 23096]
MASKEHTHPAYTTTTDNPIPNNEQSNEPPDGGYGWVCTVAAAIINAHSWGFNSAYAVFLAYYLDNEVFPGATPLQYAFVGSLSLTCLFLTSPIATIAVRKVGLRPTMFCGVALESASLVAASFASRIWHLFLTQGILFGTGLGLLFIPTAAIVPQWFTTKRSLASGVALSGAGAGGLIYSLSAAAMIRSLGLETAFRILAILAFVVNTSCTLLVKDRSQEIGANQAAFNTSLFRKPEYLLLLGFSAFTMLGYFVLIFSLADYATQIGLNSTQASLASAVFNLGQAVGRPLAGYFSDTTGRVNMATVITFVAGILPLAVWTSAQSYGVLMFFALSEGLVAGSFWATIAPLVAEVVGLKQTSQGLNLLWLAIVVPCTFSEPVALEIFQGTGSYLGTQLFTGFMYVAAAGCLLVLRGMVGTDEYCSGQGGIWRRCFRWKIV